MDGAGPGFGAHGGPWGPIGLLGPMGPMGPKGPMGPMGPLGPHGLVAMGVSCLFPLPNTVNYVKAMSHRAQ